jgi:hypothetical protein
VLFWTLELGSGMNIPDHFSESLETFFGLRIFKFFDADANPGSGIFFTLDPGFVMEKFGSGNR